MAELNFDANQYEPSGEFEPIPSGKYAATITASQTKPTKNGTGSYLELTFKLIGGEYNGRQIWARLNLDNPTPKAVEIAKGQLSAICRSVGVMRPRNSEELHNMPMTIKIVVKKNEKTGELFNEIKAFGPISESKPGAPMAQASKVDADTPPWRRG